MHKYIWLPWYHGPTYHGITYNTAMTATQHISDIKLTKESHVAGCEVFVVRIWEKVYRIIPTSCVCIPVRIILEWGRFQGETYLSVCFAISWYFVTELHKTPKLHSYDGVERSEYLQNALAAYSLELFNNWLIGWLIGVLRRRLPELPSSQ